MNLVTFIKTQKFHINNLFHYVFLYTLLYNNSMSVLKFMHHICFACLAIINITAFVTTVGEVIKTLFLQEHYKFVRIK